MPSENVATLTTKNKHKQWMAFQRRWLTNLRKQILGTDEHFGNPLKDDCPAPILPPKVHHAPRRTLVLDLDETLVHSEFHQDKGWMTHMRGGADHFLIAVGGLFEVVLFTSGVQEYADPIIDSLDKRRIISHRLFRESCLSLGGIHIKDLSRLGRDLSSTIIIDNSPEAYLLQPENAIPIKPFFGGGNDSALLELLELLQHIVREDVEDIRPLLKKCHLKGKFICRSQSEKTKKKKKLARHKSTTTSVPYSPTLPILKSEIGVYEKQVEERRKHHNIDDEDKFFLNQNYNFDAAKRGGDDDDDEGGNNSNDTSAQKSYNNHTPTHNNNYSPIYWRDSSIATTLFADNNSSSNNGSDSSSSYNYSSYSNNGVTLLASQPISVPRLSRPRESIDSTTTSCDDEDDDSMSASPPPLAHTHSCGSAPERLLGAGGGNSSASLARKLLFDDEPEDIPCGTVLVRDLSGELELLMNPSSGEDNNKNNNNIISNPNLMLFPGASSSSSKRFPPPSSTSTSSTSTAAILSTIPPSTSVNNNNNHFATTTLHSNNNEDHLLSTSSRFHIPTNGDNQQPPHHHHPHRRHHHDGSSENSDFFSGNISRSSSLPNNNSSNNNFRGDMYSSSPPSQYLFNGSNNFYLNNNNTNLHHHRFDHDDEEEHLLKQVESFVIGDVADVAPETDDENDEEEAMARRREFSGDLEDTDELDSSFVEIERGRTYTINHPPILPHRHPQRPNYHLHGLSRLEADAGVLVCHTRQNSDPFWLLSKMSPPPATCLPSSSSSSTDKNT